MPTRRTWRWPWGYTESAVLAGAVIGGGFAAQWLAGPVPAELLAWPRNLWLAGALSLLIALARPLRRSRAVRLLRSAPFCATLMGAMALFALAIGLVPQLPPGPVAGPATLAVRLGLRQVTSSWPFSFLYLLTLVALGLAVSASPSLKRPVFFLNHAGLWLVLVAAAFGAPDRRREIVRVPEGGVEWRSTQGGEIKELELAIRLDDFVMEEHPARLALIDPATGRPWPSESAPELFQLGPGPAGGRLGGYDVAVERVLAKGLPVADGTFVRAAGDGAVQAALVKAVSRESGEAFEGWVSSGNGLVRPSSLRLGGGGTGHGLVLAMARPEPRLFLSRVKVFTKEGQEIEGQVAVNRPLRAGRWLIYQRDYDVEAGPLSSWSGFELIKDGWLNMAYAGFVLWAAGCLGLLLGRGR